MLISLPRLRQLARDKYAHERNYLQSIVAVVRFVSS